VELGTKAPKCDVGHGTIADPVGCRLTGDEEERVPGKRGVAERKLDEHAR
jgi:hypothetical protein